MRNVTLSDLRTKIREISDQVNSGFIQDSELNNYINDSIAELYDKLVSAHEEDYFKKTFTITTKQNVEGYNVPADFYQLLGLDLVLDSTRRITLKRYSWNDRNKARGQYLYSNYLADGFEYRLTANKIEFLPTPATTKTVIMHYVPTASKLTEDDDIFDGINGWDTYIIYDCAIKILTKEESDCSLYIKKLADIDKRIDGMKATRDSGQPEKVCSTDSSLTDLYDGVIFR